MYGAVKVRFPREGRLARNVNGHRPFECTRRRAPVAQYSQKTPHRVAFGNRSRQRQRTFVRIIVYPTTR